MRSGRLFRFITIPRWRRLYRCPDCELATDAPEDHARTHLSGRRGNPGRPEGETYHEVIIEPDLPTVEEVMASAGPLHGQPIPQPGELAVRLHEAELMAAKLAIALEHTQEYVGPATLPPIVGWSWYDALQAYYAWRPPLAVAPQRPDPVMAEHGSRPWNPPPPDPEPINQGARRR